MKFLRLIEGYLPTIPNGNWFVLASGAASRSGCHSFGLGDYEIPAAESEACPWDYAVWNAFPGQEGDGSDIPEEERLAIERIYFGKKCAHVTFSNPASSYHYSASDFFIIINLDRDQEDALEDLGGGLPTFSSPRRGRLYDVVEFTYTGVDQLKALMESRDSATNFKRPLPGETSKEFWSRQIKNAQAHGWIKKRDGD